MKFLSFLIAICSIIFFIAGCTKTGAGENTTSPANDLIGTWHIKNYIAANLTNGQPNDTVKATHNETFIFTADSLFTDSWLSLVNDYTVSPPVFKVIDTIEHKGAFAYTKDGDKYTVKLSTFSETVYIIDLTGSQLTVDEKLQEHDSHSICKDLYTNFTK